MYHNNIDELARDLETLNSAVRDLGRAVKVFCWASLAAVSIGLVVLGVILATS